METLWQTTCRIHSDNKGHVQFYCKAPCSFEEELEEDQLRPNHDVFYLEMNMVMKGMYSNTNILDLFYLVFHITIFENKWSCIFIHYKTAVPFFSVRLVKKQNLLFWLNKLAWTFKSFAFGKEPFSTSNAKKRSSRGGSSTDWIPQRCNHGRWTSATLSSDDICFRPRPCSSKS